MQHSMSSMEFLKKSKKDADTLKAEKSLLENELNEMKTKEEGAMQQVAQTKKQLEEMGKELDSAQSELKKPAGKKGKDNGNNSKDLEKAKADLA